MIYFIACLNLSFWFICKPCEDCVICCCTFSSLLYFFVGFDGRYSICNWVWINLLLLFEHLNFFLFLFFFCLPQFVIVFYLRRLRRLSEWYLLFFQFIFASFMSIFIAGFHEQLGCELLIFFFSCYNSIRDWFSSIH